MTRHEQIISEFRRNGNRMTLGQMLQYPWGYKATSRMSELRKRGYIFQCQKGERPSDNSYVLIEPEASGQLRFV